MIELSGVTHRATGRTILADVDLRFDGPRTAIIGANGSGKSTLVRLLNGLLLPTEGTVRVDGLDTRHDGPEIRRRVGLVFQNPDLQIVLPTVAEDLAFGLRRRGLDAAEIDRRVDEALEASRLDEHRDHPAQLLSGGQKQLLAIWSMLVLGPSWLVLDEPTTLLDERNGREVTDLIMGLPLGVVLATHDLRLAGRCERVVVLDGGRVVADGAPDEAITCYRTLVAP